eukprot:gene1202-1311_t
MNLGKSKFIFDRVQELGRILLNPSKSDHEGGGGGGGGGGEEEAILSFAEIEKYLRLLRPARSSAGDHGNAARLRLRQKILNHPSTGSEGPILLSRFDGSCENLRRLNWRLVAPFLTFLMPISFYEKTRPVFQNLVQAERELSQSIPSLEVKEPVKKKIFQSSSVCGGPVPPPPTTTSSAPPATATATAFGLPLAKKEISIPPEKKLEESPAPPVLSVNDLWISVEVERKLLLDIVYVLQGVTGKHIKYDSRTESYVVDPMLQLPLPARDIVLCICELGWLYNKVSAYLKTVFQGGGPDSKGLIVQAFGFALQEELHDYYRLVAVIEQELGRYPTFSGQQENLAQEMRKLTYDEDFEAKETQSDGAHEASTDGNYGLTLLRLKAWLAEPTERMIVLARLVDGAIGLTGGALISRIYAHCRHGDHQVAKVVQRVMDNVCVPLYTYLSRWMLEGELSDPQQEFFILLNNSASNMSNMWKETYRLRSTHIPSFLPSDLAEKILKIGKSINFIKLCLSRLPPGQKHLTKGNRNFTTGGMRKSYRMINKGKHLGLYGQVIDDEDVKVFSSASEENKGPSPPSDNVTEDINNNNNNNTTAVAVPNNGQSSSPSTPEEDVFANIFTTVTSQQIEEALHNLRHHQALTLSQHILVLSQHIDQQLLQLLREDFHLYNHLEALKKFMLLGQGDFINCLIDNIGPELKKRSNVLFKHNLLSILEASLRASNAQYEEEWILHHVNIRLLEANVGDTGWEIFSLDYQIAIPLNSIVHPQAMAKYRIAFHMLWRLKRVEWSLSNAWKDLVNLSHMIDRESHSSQSLLPRSHVNDVKRVLHRCNLNRSCMMHVIINLSEFLMFEVLETAWVRLKEDLDKSRSIDDLILAHDRYLDEILDKALLSPTHEALQLQIQQVMQLILRFCSLEESLVADTLAAIARKKLASGAFAGNSAAQGQTNRQRELALTIQQETIPLHLVSRIDETVKEYSAQFDVLMTMLKEEGEKSGEILRYLTFRLDFNDYHTLQKAKGAGVGITSTPRNLQESEGFKNNGGSGGGVDRAWSANNMDMQPTRLSLS